jgi:hypothetical protein
MLDFHAYRVILTRPRVPRVVRWPRWSRRPDLIDRCSGRVPRVKKGTHAIDLHGIGRRTTAIFGRIVQVPERTPPPTRQFWHQLVWSNTCVSSATMRHVPEARVPPPRGPVSASLFRYLLDLELERANRLRYCVSLVCLTPDLEDSEHDLGLTRNITRAALRQLRRTDLGTTLSRGVVGLLLVDTDPRTGPRTPACRRGGASFEGDRSCR